MIRTMLYTRATGALQTGGSELLAAWQRDPEAIVWADLVSGQQDEERQIMTSSFGLHSLAINDALRERHPPKIEAFKDHVLVLLKGLNTLTDEFEFRTIQLSIFIAARFLVTRHADHSPSIDALKQEAQQNPILLAGGPDGWRCDCAGTWPTATPGSCWPSSRAWTSSARSSPSPTRICASSVVCWSITSRSSTSW